MGGNQAISSGMTSGQVMGLYVTFIAFSIQQQ